jgi:ABC-type transport system involved in multi-copper enzyme maturation permease subunit
MFFNVLRMECDKVFKRKLPWIGLLVTVAGFLFYFAIFFYGSRRTSPLHGDIFVWPLGTISGFTIVVSGLPIFSIGMLLASIVCGAAMAQEYSWHSLQLWLSVGVPRPVLFAAKFVVCLLVILLITLVTGLTGVVTSIITALQLHRGLNTTTLDGFQWFLSWLRTSYAILPYSTMAFMLAIITRSPIVSISITLLCAAIVEMMFFVIAPLFPVLANVWHLMPWSLALALTLQNLDTNPTVSPAALFSVHPSYGPLGGAIGITIYTLVFLGIAFWVFCRQNLSE